MTSRNQRKGDCSHGLGIPLIRHLQQTIHPDQPQAIEVSISPAGSEVKAASALSWATSIDRPPNQVRILRSGNPFSLEYGMEHVLD